MTKNQKEKVIIHKASKDVYVAYLRGQAYSFNKAKLPEWKRLYEVVIQK